MIPNDRYYRNVKNIVCENFLLQSYLIMVITDAWISAWGMFRYYLTKGLSYCLIVKTVLKVL